MGGIMMHSKILGLSLLFAAAYGTTPYRNISSQTTYTVLQEFGQDPVFKVGEKIVRFDDMSYCLKKGCPNLTDAVDVTVYMKSKERDLFLKNGELSTELNLWVPGLL